jgi:hypothetical protein
VVCVESPSDTDRVIALMCVGGGGDVADSSGTERCSVFVSMDTPSVTEQRVYCGACAEVPSDADRVPARVRGGGGDACRRGDGGGGGGIAIGCEGESGGGDGVGGGSGVGHGSGICAGGVVEIEEATSDTP